MAKQIDPVCGMQVEEQEAAGKSRHEGRDYYFCSEGCKREFEENPEQFTQQTEQR